jgi:Helix-turn-helix domain of resolvase
MSDETETNDLKRDSAREDLVIALMLAGKSVEQVAKQTKISRTTLWRLRQSPEFDGRFRAARQQAFESVVNALHDSALTFVRTLRDVCEDSESRDSARATAARSGLDSLWNAAKLFDFEDRLRRLEDLASGGQK